MSVNRADLEAKLKKATRSVNAYKGKLEKAKKGLFEVQRTCTQLQKENKKLKSLPKAPKLWALKCCVCLCLASYYVLLATGQASRVKKDNPLTPGQVKKGLAFLKHVFQEKDIERIVFGMALAHPEILPAICKVVIPKFVAEVRFPESLGEQKKGQTNFK